MGRGDNLTILYPPGCREVTEDVGPDELIRRLKTLAHTLQSMGQDDGAYQVCVGALWGSIRPGVCVCCTFSCGTYYCVLPCFVSIGNSVNCLFVGCACPVCVCVCAFY
ncbi:Sister chromatid cohesion protein PDS5 A-B [Portunus trituberculatus]|uniref:Sister chromatid cohesion protein PDS5 A-B n=1 Tax=Portunus trituberculatus TaxID=210409 RepID=A0A5B7IMJ5_PORTR|nr:Sister chromatid cohesion protein PDS5 A-B [Portunus trituberculatus]